MQISPNVYYDHPPFEFFGGFPFYFHGHDFMQRRQECQHILQIFQEEGYIRIKIKTQGVILFADS